ncbi:lymphocyte activation gene 3 protein-like [Myxocyprinus asiaticus]|uniref:lymphocyte activation gene 3 protein-like n=1 Tax=Myxocyprinus asiaticus TaxID=70543 RepID=UPI002221B89C|nr:lymphocyte activation gene 3 protein-like [Myxocyprinus asiaticus]
MYLERKAQLLVVLGLALVFEGVECWNEVFVAYGAVAVLPCVDELSEPSHNNAVYWSRIVDGLLKTVWRQEKSGLEFRSVRHPPRARCPVLNFGKEDYSLHITDITDEDGGMYLCEVKGKILMRKDIMLRVIKVSFSPVIVVEGSRVEVACHISPEPQFGTVSKKINGSLTSKAVLHNVYQKHAGNWTCLVLYRGVSGEATASLQVKGIVTPRDDSSVVYAAVGTSVSLPCVFTDGLMPNTVTWQRISKTKHSSVPLPSSFNQSLVSTVSHPSWDRSAWIKRVEEGDEGIYTCSGMMEGSNGGRMKVERRMQLVVTQVQSSSASSSYGPVTLTCHLSNSSFITSYEWLRVTNRINNTQTVTSVKKSKELRIQKVTEKDIGGWVCRYYGKQGVLGNITYQLHMMGALMGESKSSSGNNVPMVMGLGFLFLVIFLILLQMYRNYRRKKRILLYPAMETIVHQAATERERRERCKAKINEALGEEPK